MHVAFGCLQPQCPELYFPKTRLTIANYIGHSLPTKESHLPTDLITPAKRAEKAVSLATSGFPVLIQGEIPWNPGRIFPFGRLDICCCSLFVAGESCVASREADGESSTDATPGSEPGAETPGS